uniref:Uncharacterized protein n=1 Tax=uncultured marine virus TaxID=186617 RepID=A0A0F7L759_9VIRU|nr:hypothetical protein [uncultured marine virus]
MPNSRGFSAGRSAVATVAYSATEKELPSTFQLNASRSEPVISKLEQVAP